MIIINKHFINNNNNLIKMLIKNIKIFKIFRFNTKSIHKIIFINSLIKKIQYIRN